MTGGFQVGPFQPAYQQSGVAPAVIAQVSGLGGPTRKKRRGPYSDQAIYEAYIERCIAERQAPRVEVEVAVVVLKEALIEAVQERKEDHAAELAAITKENELLHRLIAVEKVKRNAEARRNVESIIARQRQIAARIEELDEDETRAIITLLDEM